MTHYAVSGSVLISRQTPRPLPGGSKHPCGGGRRARCDLGLSWESLKVGHYPVSLNLLSAAS